MSEDEALDAYAKLPLSFVPNEGQANEAVRYYARGAGYGIFFQRGAMVSLADGKGHGHALGLDFLGANSHPTLEAELQVRVPPSPRRLGRIRRAGIPRGRGALGGKPLRTCTGRTSENTSSTSFGK
jgi:hypothetical protein